VKGISCILEQTIIVRLHIAALFADIKFVVAAVVIKSHHCHQNKPWLFPRLSWVPLMFISGPLERSPNWCP